MAAAWWDVERVPCVVWDEQATTYWLADPQDPSLRLHLVTLDAPPPVGAVRLATVLASGLAGCDFPPTGDGADPGTVAATLRAHGIA